MNQLLRWVSGRHAWRELPRTVLTVLGIALGVAVFVSIRLASTSALASFSDTVDAVAGRANLTVSADTDGFDERVLGVVRGASGVVAAAPLVEVYAAARPGGPLRSTPEDPASPGRQGYDETLLILGLDPFVEGPFARYGALQGEAGDLNPFELLSDPRGAAITRTLARRHGLEMGDTITVLSAGRPAVLRVRAIATSDALEQAFGGNVAIVDIGVAQEVFQRAGRLDRIDLIAEADHIADVERALAAALPAGVRVQTPAGRSRQVENMVQAFALNLTALSFIALFVAGFLIFNASAMATLRRRGEIGMLRAIGATRRQVLAMFVAEGVALGVTGSLLGLALGTVLARVTLSAVGRTLSDLYLVTHAERLVLDPATYAMGFVVGAVVAFIAALAPAIEAAATPPVHAVRQGVAASHGDLPVGRWTIGGLLVLALAGMVAWWTVRDGRPEGGFLSAFLVLAGFSCLVPAIALLIETLAGPVLKRIVGIEGALGARYLREAVGRTSVIIAAVMVSVGMMVALAIMVGSFRQTVDVWIGQSLKGDLYVEPVGHRLSLASSVLPAAWVDSVRALPGVAAVDTYRGARLPLGERIVFVAGVDFAVQRDHGHLSFMHGESADVLARALVEEGVIVTESFHHHFGLGPGDTLALATPSGPARLAVHGVFYDYTTDAGAILMDRSLYARLWRDSRTESLALYLAPGADLDATRRALLALAGDRVLHVIPNQALRTRVLTVFDQTFQITWALQAIAILVAVLGVIAALTALILQRGREIGVLRAAGALRSQVRTIVLVESGLLGFIGAALGCACGYVLSLLLVHVINRQFFGWTIRMHVDGGVFVQALVLMVLAALLAGIGPARLAARRPPAEATRMD